MFGLFLTGACLDFVLMFLLPLSVYTRWMSLPLSILSFFNALIIIVAVVIATVMFIIFRDAITSATQLNIKANIGVEMFAFMWIAAGTALISFIIQMGMCCCCASRRDIRLGKKTGSKKAWQDGETPGISEKPAKRKLPVFGRAKRES